MIPLLSIHPREEKPFVNQTTTKLYTNVYNSYVQPSKTGHPLTTTESRFNSMWRDGGTWDIGEPVRGGGG